MLMFVPGLVTCCQFVLFVFQRLFCAPLQFKLKDPPKIESTRALLEEANPYDALPKVSGDPFSAIVWFCSVWPVSTTFVPTSPVPDKRV